MTKYIPALLLLLVVGLLAWQGPQPIPPFEGDGNSMHDGQPMVLERGHEDAREELRLQASHGRQGVPGGGPPLGPRIAEGLALRGQ